MNDTHPTPKGYFNATDMIVPDYQGVKLKPNHFLGRKKVQLQLDKIGKDPIIYRGRGACTFIPLEMKNFFIAWLALNTKG